LRQGSSEQLQVPVGSIIYHPVTVNIHYPKSNTWSQEVIEDIRAYSVAEDRQGELQLLRSWKSALKDALQDAISGLTGEDNLVVWNWYESHYLGYIKMLPLAWRTLLCMVYKKICNGYPARDYVLTNLYTNQEELRGAYSSVPKIMDNYVENICSDVFWVQKQGEKTMEMMEILHRGYPNKMIPIFHHHYFGASKNFCSENITHYLCVTMFVCYNVEAKNVK
jgi:hypothetical protein